MIAEVTYKEWLRTRYRPVKGAEGDDDPEDPAASGGDPADPDPADPADPDPADPADPDPTDPSGGGDPTDADTDEFERLKRERDEARKKLADAEASARRAKGDASKARQEAAKSKGNWEAVAKERESELADANEQLQAARAAESESKQELTAFRREVRVTRIASQLGYHDPGDALAQLASANQLEAAADDDKSCLRALRKLADEKPYLVDARRRRGREMNGNGGAGGGLSFEDLQNMTPEQINKAWETGGVQTALASRAPNRGG